MAWYYADLGFGLRVFARIGSFNMLPGNEGDAGYQRMAIRGFSKLGVPFWGSQE